jgi:hypothetical protein
MDPEALNTTGIPTAVLYGPPASATGSVPFRVRKAGLSDSISGGIVVEPSDIVPKLSEEVSDLRVVSVSSPEGVDMETYVTKDTTSVVGVPMVRSTASDSVVAVPRLVAALLVVEPSEVVVCAPVVVVVLAVVVVVVVVVEVSSSASPACPEDAAAIVVDVVDVVDDVVVVVVTILFPNFTSAVFPRAKVVCCGLPEVNTQPAGTVSVTSYDPTGRQLM